MQKIEIQAMVVIIIESKYILPKNRYNTYCKKIFFCLFTYDRKRKKYNRKDYFIYISE